MRRGGDDAMKLTDFQKKRIGRMAKACAEMLCRLHGKNKPGDDNVAEGILTKFADDVLKIMKDKPNKDRTASFSVKLPDYGDLMTVKAFKESCKSGGFMDYDGTGHPVGRASIDHASCLDMAIRNGVVKRTLLMDPTITIRPSEYDDLPAGTTHVMWFNR
jgi:hypothetical protein